MVIVDTNILVSLIRGVDESHINGLLRDNSAAICGVVRAEVLHGARSQSERRQAVAILNALDYIPTPESIWDVVGDNLRVMRGAGISVPLMDALIATLAIVNGLELWSRVAHFPLMQRALSGLKMFQEQA